MNAHQNVGSAVRRSDDKKKGGGWLFGEKCELGEQRGHLVVLCNHGSVERERDRAVHILSGGLHCLFRPLSSCWQCVHSAALVYTFTK